MHLLALAPQETEHLHGLLSRAPCWSSMPARRAPAAHAHGLLSRHVLPPGEFPATGRDEVSARRNHRRRGHRQGTRPGRRWPPGPALRRTARATPSATPRSCASVADDLAYFTPPGRLNPRAQVITAASEGCAAAIAINADLVNEGVLATVAGRSSLRPDAPDPPAPREAADPLAADRVSLPADHVRTTWFRQVIRRSSETTGNGSETFRYCGRRPMGNLLNNPRFPRGIRSLT